MNKKNGKGLLCPLFKEKKLSLNKAVVVIITTLLSQLGIAGYAQQIPVTLNVKHTSVKDVLKEIESKTEYTFFYNDAEVDTERRVDVQAQNERLDAVLARIMPNNKIVVDNKRIMILPQANVTAGNNNQIIGKVIDNYGEPLIGVNVQIKGTAIGVVTDIDGNFHINADKNASLVFSYIGYTSQTVAIGDKTHINITLLEDTQLIDEVVVVGFAKQKKANLTGSVSSVKMDDVLGDRPIATTGAVLQGSIPGLQTTVGSGEPGAGYSFNIRGMNSINDGTPLIVVDNVPYAGAIELLNPDDIETITVLKDGGAAAIYGARSTFGVILITTKGATANQRFQVNYNNNFTFTSPWALPKKASPRETVQAYKDAGLASVFTGQSVDEWLGYLDNSSKYPLGYVINDNGLRYSLTESDILGDFFDTGFEQKHDITASGGTDKLSYRISFGYTDQNGVMASDKDRFKRYNFRTYVNAQFTKWLTGQVDMSYIKSDKTMPNNQDYMWATAYPSYVEMIDIEYNGEIIPAGSPANLAKLGGTNTNARSKNRITGKLIATPIKGLTINAEYTYDDLRRTQTDFNKKLRVTSPAKYEPETRGTYSTLTKTHYQTQLNIWNIYASYNKSINKHNFTGLIGFNQEEYYYEEIKNVGKDFISDELPAFNLAQEWEPISDKYDEYGLRGYFGRINYDYDSRYLFEFNGRYDGSSKFPNGSRWGFFPSVSVGWNIMREPFMEKFVDYVPEFKIRSSYSTIGNQNVKSYLFNPSMSGNKAVWIVDGNRPTTLGTPGLVSDNFTWETVETYNLGFDISLLRNRLQASVDIYRRNTKDMLTDAMELPALVGANAPKQNVADLRSDGFEIELKWNDQIGNVKYYLGASLYDYKSKITKFDNESGLFYKQNESQDAKRYRKGMEIGEIWGYTFDRFYTENDFDENGKLKEGIAYVKGTTPKPGDVLFVNYDDDPLITDGSLTEEDPGDLKVIGNSALRWQYGINGGVSWKNISFSFALQGVGKRDVWIESYLTQPFSYEYGTIYKHQLNYWTPENTNSKYPRLYPTGNRDNNYKANFNRSDRYLLNGAYLRVQNLTLGYTFPSSLIKTIGLTNLRVYTSVENPFIFNHLPKGLDPTLKDNGGGLGYPIMRAFSMGFSVTL